MGPAPMDEEFRKALVFLFVPCIGVLVWLIRLEGRVNTNQALQERISADVSWIRDQISKLIHHSGDKPSH